MTRSGQRKSHSLLGPSGEREVDGRDDAERRRARGRAGAARRSAATAAAAARTRRGNVAGTIIGPVIARIGGVCSRRARGRTGRRPPGRSLPLFSNSAPAERMREVGGLQRAAGRPAAGTPRPRSRPAPGRGTPPQARLDHALDDQRGADGDHRERAVGVAVEHREQRRRGTPRTGSPTPRSARRKVTHTQGA